MPPAGRSLVLTFSYSVALLLFVSWTLEARALQSSDPVPLTSTVSTIATVETDRFTDATLVGRDESDFRDKWIRFVTATNPDGIVTRVRGFNPATGEFTLHDPIPAGTVMAGETYRVGSTPSAVGASGTSSFLMASTEPGCQPAGTAGPDVIVCTGTDAAGVASEEGRDAVVVTDGAVVAVDRVLFSQIRIDQHATAVDAGEGVDSVLNAGAITADTDAVLAPLLTPPSPIAGASQVWAALIQNNLESKGIEAGAGGDEITNTGTVTATSTAVILPSTFPVNIPGLSSADVSSKARARSTALEGGDHDDSVANSGTLSSSAGATAAGVGVSFVPGGEDAGSSTIKGDVKANAAAVGLAGGAGDDTVGNSAAIDVRSSTSALAVAGALLTVHGSSGVSAKSTSGAIGFDLSGADEGLIFKFDSGATGIDLGGGNDALVNQGAVTATSTAIAESLNVGVATPTSSSRPSPLKSAVSGGATANAHATGISADAQAEKISVEDLSSFDFSSDGNGFITIDKVQLTLARPNGDDTITNDGAVQATAAAVTRAAGVGVTVDGATSADVKSSADAQATAVDLGGGHDELTNTGRLTAAADATANALGLSVAVKDKSPKTTERTSAAEGSAEAQARATGIAADSPAADASYSLELTIENGRRLTPEEAAVVNQGVIAEIANDRIVKVTEEKARASGDDTVVNSGAVGATATSRAGAAGVGVTIDASAAAKITGTAEADAVGIDLGGGHDSLGNTGTLTATSDARATALNVAVGVSSSSSSSPASGSTADAGATAGARATGLTADGSGGDTTRSVELGITDFGDCKSCLRLTFAYEKTETRATGDDAVTNSGNIEARATGVANAAGVGVTVRGAAAANSKSTANATAAAIDLGGGADTLTNTGALTAVGDSTAQALAVAVSTKGKAAASDGFWQGGIKSGSAAFGIDADGKGDETTEVEIRVWDTLSVRYETRTDSTVANGSDWITNLGDIVVQAFARSLTANVGVTSEGMAAAFSHAEGKAEAVGIRAGQADDTVQNLGPGSMTVTSDAQASAVSAAVSGKGVAVAADALWDTGTRAEATATGIDADGGSAEVTLVTVELREEADDTIESKLVYQTSTDNASGSDETAAAVGSGNDVIVNEQAVGVSATAAATSVGVSLEAKKGLAATVSAVSSEAESAAIRGGHGDDSITNRGQLTSTATASADGVSIAIAVQGVAAATNSVWDGGTTAEARAVGIDGDGNARSVKNTTLAADGFAARIDHTITEQAASGNDTILNAAAITAGATATTLQAAVAATTKGLSAAVSQSTARAEAVAIRGGDGDDDITNAGHLTSTATSTATAANVALAFETGGAIAGNAIWDGGVTAEATAVGIQGDGGTRESVWTTTIRTNHGDVIERSTVEEAARGDDVILNTNRIDAAATATAPAVSVGFSTQGVAGAVSTATAKSNAAAIDLGAGNDQLVNVGSLNATSTSLAVAVNGSVVNSGLAVAGNNSWDGGVSAGARARGIDGGGGEDQIVNAGAIAAESTATSPAATVAIAVSGVPVAVSTASATSDATAIHGGDGEEADEILNLGGGRLTANATARGFAANVALSNSGLAIAADAVWDGGTKAEATAKGIDTWLGDDTIANAAAIDATADASVTSLAISAVVSGIAGATATSTAKAAATAIDAGAASGVDVVSNTGALTATSNASAESTAVSLTASGAAVAAGAVWDGGTTAESTARGIASESGADVRNAGTVEAFANASAASGAVSGAVSGVAAAIATSTATSNATAIDTGASNSVDAIVNAGRLRAESSAQAATLTAGVTTTGISAAGDAAWDGGTRGEAMATGIHAGGGADAITNDGDIEAEADALTLSANVSVALSGLAGGIGTSTAIAKSTAIDAGAGDDTVLNTSAHQAQRTGKLTSQADATASAAAVSVTLAGIAVSADAVWDGGTTAEATAKGIDAGSGADTVVNESEIQAQSHATTVSIAGAVAVEGVAGAIADATGTSHATAVDGGDSDDRIVNSGKLEATAVTHAVSTALGFTKFGVSAATNSFWDGGTTGSAFARGIFGGQGADTIFNSGRIDAFSDAQGVSAAVAANVAGVAGAVSTATANAQATAVDGGDADDIIENRQGGFLAARADATGVAVNVAVTGAGVVVAADSVWDGGTEAEATARGIDGGKGRDTITNAELIGVTANSATVSNAVTVVGIGAGGASSTSTSTAKAIAIDGGDDADAIGNQGNLTATSNATATGVAVTATGIGAVGSFDAFWDGGTAANANAAGIAGGAGDDLIVNTAGSVTANATATTHSVSVSVAGAGLAGAAVGSTATARATGIDGGAGADDILYAGAIASNATSHAGGVSVTATLAGGALAGSFVDNVTKAESIATGLAGGSGHDTITSAGLSAIVLTSSADTTDTAVSVNVAGSAGADTQAHAIARATGQDGGEGEDRLDNRGVITGTTTAESRGRSVSVAVAGNSSGDASGTAETFAVGMDGGSDDDVVLNQGQISLTSNATARSQSVNVSVAGGVLSDAQGVGRATAIGLAGGAGDDAMLNSGTITLRPTASAFGQSVGVSVAGASLNDASAVAQAFATGMDGGVGDDTIINTGAISATVSSTTTARNTGVVVAGSTLDRSNSTAEATAIGIDGGGDADLISNASGANINVAATATTNATGVTVSVFGAGGGEAETSPVARATGLEGGAGHDQIVNDGMVRVSAASTSTSSGSRTNILGSAGGTAGTSAQSTATGIGGGTGEDWLLNRFTVGVDAASTATVSGSSWNLAGTASDSSSLNAMAGAFGMDGGSGADRIRNEGDVLLTLSSSLTATGGSDAIFGNASADTQMTALSQGFGLAGGGGADTIENAARIDVSSRANVTSNRASATFAGSPSTDALLVARAEATGIDGGTEADSIRNDGTIRVRGASTSNVSGGATTTFGGTTTGGVGTSDARAVGIEGGAGANAVTNAGLVDVAGDAEAIVSNNSSSGLFVGVANTRAEGRATAHAAGVSAGDGDNVLTNAGELRVAADGAGFGFAYASGAHISIKGDGEALADGRAAATAIGMSAGHGRNMIVNNSRIAVSSVASTLRNLTTTTNVCSQEIITVRECHEEAGEDGEPVEVCTEREETVTTCEDREIVLSSSPTYAGANGNGLAGDGTATARGTATGEAYGIRVGHGENTIVNQHEVTVTASPDAKARAFADGDAFGDARGTAAATAQGTAVGISAGHGNNSILNAGMLTVVAEPTAQARTDVTGGDICITFLFWTWCGGGGDGIGTSTATLNGQAFGILVGNGDNSIVNEGTIHVTAAPAVADGFTASVIGADSSTVRTTVTSRAIGIQTGDGDNQIFNAAGGVIDVVARDASVCNGACTTTLEAVGVRTGAGDDLIVNDGVITTSVVPRSGAASAGVAIDAGAGNDRVVLGAGSRTSGTVLLGAGNDTLVWTGTAALNGIAFGESGTDMFALGGAVDADFALSEIGARFREFDLFHKQGPSTWGLLGDRRIDWTVDEGTLAIKGTITGTVDTSAGAVNAVIAVTPAGTVRRDDTLAAAVRLNGGGMLINDGLVEATAAGGVAVEAFGNGNHLVNSSWIRSAGVGLQVDGDGNRLENAGTVQTTGTRSAIAITGNDNSLVNDGLVVGITEAVSLEGRANAMTNRGSVTAEGVAVRIDGSDGTVLNEGVIASIGASGAGVVLAGDGSTLTNRGAVTAHGTAVLFESAAGDSGTVLNERGGVILSTGGVAIQGGDGNDRVENHGRVAGGAATAIDLAGGDDELVIVARSEIAVAARGGAGFDTFVLGGAEDASFDLSDIGPRYQEFELFRKQGSSTWTLFGDAVADWRVDQATLAIDGSVWGTVATSSGALDPVIAVHSTGTVRRNDELAAVVLNGSATLVNDGLIETNTGAGSAVQALGSANQITNSGQIRSDGIALQVTGDGNVLSNAGTVQSNGTAAVSMAGANNSLSNAGLIEATVGGAAVELTGHASSVTNSGQIRSAGVAVEIKGGDGALVNQGLIAGAEGVRMKGHETVVSNQGDILAAGVGVELEGDRSSIVNAGTVQSYGTAGAAVSMAGANNSLSNAGLIEATDGGVALAALGDTNRITNSGDIRSAGVGLQVTGEENLLSNAGNVEGAGGGVTMAGRGNAVSNAGLIEASHGGVAVELFGDAGSVVNTGEIWSSGIGIEVTGADSVVVNNGMVAGPFGVRMKGHAATLINQGDILATHAGVTLEGDGGSILNAGTVAAEGVGIAVSGDDVTIINEGSVRSASAGGAGIVLAGNGVELTNLGLITAHGTAVSIESGAGATGAIVNAPGALIHSSGGLAVEGGAGAERFENYGTVIGGAGTAVDLAGGDDELLMNTGSAIAGIATGGAGSDTVSLTGSGQGIADLTMFGEFETLKKAGSGTWLLDGSGEMAWDLSEGQLIVQGVLSGDGIVQANSRLMGSGSVGGFVNEGTVAPGASIGTLTINGDYEHASGAILEIEGTITGASDRIDVTGRAVLNGGTVEVLPETRSYGVATEYTIVNASGGVAGAFGSATSSLGYLDPFLDYGPNAVFLMLIRNDVSFRSMADTSNLQALGAALDANKKAMARGDFKGLMDEFLVIDEAQQRAGLSSLSGELHATTLRTALRTGNRFFSAAVERQLSARRVETERKAFWVDAFGFSGALEGDGNASAARYRAAGLAAGVDVAVTDATRIGAAVGFSPGRTQLDQLGGGKASIRSYHPALYGEHDGGRWDVGVGIGYSRHTVSTARGVHVGSIARHAGADYAADQYSGAVRAAFDLRATPSVSVKAFGELRYSKLTRDGFTESGADSASLTEVGYGRTESLRSALGVHASWEPRFWGMRVKPELKAAWARESLNDRGELTAALTGAPGAAGFERFTIRGVTEARDSALLSLGATTAFVRNGQAFVVYDGSLTGRGSEHGFAAGMRLGW